MKKKQTIDLDKLRPLSVAEAARRPNAKWNTKAQPPELFEDWWTKHGDNNWSVKHAAREGWYACAESLGAYD